MKHDQNAEHLRSIAKLEKALLKEMARGKDYRRSAAEHLVRYEISKAEAHSTEVGAITIEGWIESNLTLPVKRVRLLSRSKACVAQLIDKSNGSSSSRQIFSVVFRPDRGVQEIVLQFAYRKNLWRTFSTGRTIRSWVGRGRVRAVEIEGRVLSYQEWILKYEARSQPDLKTACSLVSGFGAKPKISILLPIYNPQMPYLKAAIDSVLSQVYPEWELCIADDASEKGDVIESYVRNIQRKEPRIKWTRRKTNGHISACTNTALEMATGDYITFLDHDDLLSPLALFYVVDALNRFPDAKLIYTDEDKLDFSGQRCDPHFKSAWNPELLVRQNYICHLAVYKKTLVEEVGGMRCGFEGAQDWDLALRASERLSAQEILHIPRVLYHWRKHVQSTALCASLKPYVADSIHKCVQSHLDRQQQGGSVTVRPNHASAIVVYDCGKTPVPVTLIIPTRDRADLLRLCVNSIFYLTEYPEFEILIVDNGSRNQSTKALYDEITQSTRRVRILRHDAPFNFAQLCNLGVASAKTPLVGLINNDIEVRTPNWLRAMVGHAIRRETGVVGARLVYPDGSVQHGGVLLGIGQVAGHAYKHHLVSGSARGFAASTVSRNYSAVTAACALVRRDVYEAVGGMDEKHLAVAYNDVDFCLKVATLGYRNVYCAEAELIHHESRSRGRDVGEEKLRRFAKERDVMLERWGRLLRNDPYYHPNLTRTAEDLSLRVTDFDWESDLTPRRAVISQEDCQRSCAIDLKRATVV